MKMIARGLFVLLFIPICIATYAEDVKTNNDFTKYDKDGNVVLHGTYIRDVAGKVIRYDVQDADGNLSYSDIPYYRNDGAIIRGDTIAPDGSIIRVAVIFESTVKTFDKDGNHIPEYDGIYSLLEQE